MSNSLHVLPGFTIYTGAVPDLKVPVLAWVNDDIEGGKRKITRLATFENDMAQDLFDMRLKAAVHDLLKHDA